MDCIATRIPYRQTGYFSKIVLDYVDQAPQLKPFFSHPPTKQGIREAIEQRKKADADRDVLVAALKKQYSAVHPSDAVQKNIDALLSAETFTITTAHQPNIFTGPLFFIYKMLHAVRLAHYCKSVFPEYHFVPVYWMGSEDADLDELGHIHLEGEKRVWETRQTGAVGRMIVDAELLKLIDSISGQISVHPHGTGITGLMKEYYLRGTTIQEATFRFVNALFGEYGLVVLIPDSHELKKQFIPVFEDELLNGASSKILNETAEKLHQAGYKTQVNPREINLFYLGQGKRERISRKDKNYSGQETGFLFREEDLKKELATAPEKFSPNVVLRGLYQCSILPDVAFIGGGGEMAYWLQLKDLFAHYKVPFPVLVLRNSFLVVEKKWQEKIGRLGFSPDDFFLSVDELIKRLVVQESGRPSKLNGTFAQTEMLYDTLKKQAAAADHTLARHVDALKAQTLHRLQELEKKMLRAEKRKYSDRQRQIQTIKEKLFPANGLQERHENFLSFYARWGQDFIRRLYEHSLCLEQEFVVLCEK